MRYLRGLSVGMAIGFVLVMIGRVDVWPAGAFSGGWGERMHGGAFPWQWVRGSGVSKSEARQVQRITAVRLETGGLLKITQGTQESLTVEADDNLLPLLTSTVTDGTLRLSVEHRANIRPTRPVQYQLTVKEISRLELAGSGKIETSALTAKQLTLRVDGSGDINAGQVNADALTAEISGSGNLVIASGAVAQQNVRISGSGDYAAGLVSKAAQVAIFGSGNAKVQATDTLNASIFGSGNVEYRGSPQVARQIRGSGDVRPLGSR